MRYQQQKGYPGKLSHLVALLDAWIQKDGGIDFVLHGGDLVDSASKDNIRRGRELFRLSVPVYLCLGNHDLTDQNALDLWLAEAPELFPSHSPNYSVQSGDCFVHVVPNQWCSLHYYWEWEIEQYPYFVPHQLGELEATLVKHPDVIHILSTHSPVLGVPSEQTGFTDSYHDPGVSFSEVVFDLVRRYPQIRCVLASHNHINMHVEKDGVHFVTVSAFVESPFEFKVIEVRSGMLKMSTISLVSKVGFRVEYDYDKTYVQGRAKDRAFVE